MNDSPIMRRCKDDWVNATQILKCCNFPKAKRTKILEKGVQQGLHEKFKVDLEGFKVLGFLLRMPVDWQKHMVLLKN